MSELALTYRGTVYPWQCDHLGHMNVMWYVGKFDEASWQLLATLGFTRIRCFKFLSNRAAVLILFGEAFSRIRNPFS
jgi:hypothetical protein